MKRNYMRDALERVINEKGMATWPDQRFVSKAVMDAWSKAHRLGYVRAVEDEEVQTWLATRRGVRSVLLGMLERSATDETLDPTDAFEHVRPMVDDVSERLGQVVFDIHHAAKEDASYFTLTPSGLAKLGEVN